MKKVLLCIAIVSIIASVGMISASASFCGSGADVIADDVSLIKSGIAGKTILFSDTDFKSALATASFKKVTFTEIPPSSEGTLMLGERRVYTGQTVKRKNLSQLKFIPADVSVSESSFKFKTDTSQDASINCEIKLLETVNYAPEVNSDAKESLFVTTQKGVSVFGKIDVTDPEDDALEYIIVSYPKYGSVVFTDEDMGEFKYTPRSEYGGKDSFVFTVRDEYGNYTPAEKVEINVIDRMSEVVYSDMESSKSYNAALAMTALGIMNGNKLGDQTYFSPNVSVSRAEFVAMALKAVGIKADTNASATFFDDTEEIPAALVGYVSKASRMGIVTGSFEEGKLIFRPQDAITKCEAAIIMSRLIGKNSDSEVSTDLPYSDSIPVWARECVSLMYGEGIFATSDNIDLNDIVTREETAEYLYKIINLS